MSSMHSLQSFTKALTAFCFIVFIYFFIPESFSKTSDLFQYIIIVATILILMLYYNKVLGELSMIESTAVWHWFFTEDPNVKDRILNQLFEAMYGQYNLRT